MYYLYRCVCEVLFLIYVHFCYSVYRKPICPIPLMFFNLVADMLAVIIVRAKEDGQVGGLVHHLKEGGGNRTLIRRRHYLVSKHDLEKAVNMKLILALFEQLSVSKLIFIKGKSFVSVRLRRYNTSIVKYFVVKWIFSLQIFGISLSKTT